MSRSIRHFFCGSLIAGALAAIAPANALTIVLPGAPGYERSAELSSATAGAFGTGNTQKSDVTAAFPLLGTWTNPIGEATSTFPTGSGLLSITITQGGFAGQPPIAGTWTLDPLYWTKYDDAAISMHVGNGGGNPNPEPDHFIWLIERGQLTGTWKYTENTGNGGGLSNLQLWGAGDGTPVPDAGSTMILLGSGFLGIGAFRRRFSE